MHHPRRHSTIAAAAACALLLGACGQTGELYLAEDDPERAARDARSKAAPFPFPPADAQWPPEAPGEPAADAGP